MNKLANGFWLSISMLLSVPLWAPEYNPHNSKIITSRGLHTQRPNSRGAASTSRPKSPRRVKTRDHRIVSGFDYNSSSRSR